MGRKLALKIGLGIIVLIGAGFWVYLHSTEGDEPWKKQLYREFPAVSVIDENQKPVNVLEAMRTATSPKTVVSLWATWCEPCQKELPVLEKLQPKLEAKGYKLILINYDSGEVAKTIPEVKAWFVAHRLNLTTLFDPKSALLEKFGIDFLPFAFRTDETAQITWMEGGFVDWDKVDLP